MEQNNCHVIYCKGDLDLLCCLLESGRHSGIKAHRQMSSQARTSQFRMTFLVTDYIPSFHLPVDFPHKTQIVQALQGWFEDVDYLILIQLCNKNTPGLFSIFQYKLQREFPLEFTKKNKPQCNSSMEQQVLKPTKARSHVFPFCLS